MKWSHLVAAGVPVLGLQLAIAAPAQASASVVLGLPLVAVAGVSGLSGLPSSQPDYSASACEGAASAGLMARVAEPVSSKAAALLGGAPSRLELISMQQSSRTGQASQTLVTAPIAPAAGGLRCAALTQSRTLPAIYSATSRASADPENFLGSARLPLRHTTFDAQWDRVRRAGLPGRAVAAMAARSGAGASEMTLAAVNAWSNRHIRYREDSEIYGKSDYWATASATLKHGAGDCEDIAIFKMQALAALGVPRSDMYLTIARDTVRNADHALLVVKLEGRYWVLDNATDKLLDGAMSYDYRPIMSFSTSGKWLHGYTRQPEQAPTLIAAR
ncbi:transglutaminase-like cysteine peptidase [Novosphingobium pentaromativorans]|uniref:Periplasmic protein-like protein n=1 Tax=Novosphingobium pentaromativorans US6-1 TaxID=1088721 RepID=G6EIT3_9SPHN|nr:transglutaminase-like cysteine peptidase [Novosphingobium pentaromativorans]EHJ58692.1 periplasmic protein-like protein [Novosphingobium pentaromativorans US6-1]